MRETKKVHEKRENDDTFREISDFLRKDTGDEVVFLGSELLGRLRKSSDVFVNLRRRLRKPWRSQNKNRTPSS